MSLEEDKHLLDVVHADKRQFGLIYDKYYKAIFGYVYRRTVNYDIARDITSETFLKAFKRKAIFFIPVSTVGWIILLASSAYAIYTFIDIDSRSHSVSDTLINFVFNGLLIGIAYSIIGSVTQRKESSD